MRKWHLAAALAVLFFAAQPARATINYEVSIAHPERHVFGVTIRIPSVHDAVVLQMPAWNAVYQIRDFASHVMQVSARDAAGKTLPIVKLDKQTWRVTGEGSVTVTYPIFWDEPGPFGTQLNPDHAFVNLAMLLMYVPDRRKEDTRLVFDDVPDNWRVAVELDAGEPSAARTAGDYVASSYDSLVDAPVEIGMFDDWSIQAGGKEIRIVVHGENDLTRIVNYETALMGDTPFRQFLFIIHVGPNFGGGGMEHASSTAISADVPGQLAAYSAHEFFHVWNVKRIRPQSLEPVDYTKEMWTRSLWFAEGVTNTYGNYALVRTGLWSRQQFYANLAAQISQLESRPAHQWQSAEQSSLDAWFEKYPIYGRPEESVSYYNKGQLLGVALDILIRDATDNQASLDDLMRRLNTEFAQRGRFYDGSEDLRAAAEDVIRARRPSAQVDLRDFFARYVSGTDELPFEQWLGLAGLTLKSGGSRHSADITYQLSEAPQPTDKQRRIRAGMLRGTVDAPR